MEPFFFTLPKMEEKSEQQAPNQFFGNFYSNIFDTIHIYSTCIYTAIPLKIVDTAKSFSLC
jgi:hypothetical protein